jgi:hypothetical protein
MNQIILNQNEKIIRPLIIKSPETMDGRMFPYYKGVCTGGLWKISGNYYEAWQEWVLCLNPHIAAAIHRIYGSVIYPGTGVYVGSMNPCTYAADRNNYPKGSFVYDRLARWRPFFPTSSDSYTQTNNSVTEENLNIAFEAMEEFIKEVEFFNRNIFY